MGLEFPVGPISITTASGDVVLLSICDLCGAAVVEADGTDLAFHKRWHRVTGSGSWVDPAADGVNGAGKASPS